jgi:hypothetical protein
VNALANLRPLLLLAETSGAARAYLGRRLMTEQDHAARRAILATLDSHYHTHRGDTDRDRDRDRHDRHDT